MILTEYLEKGEGENRRHELGSLLDCGKMEE